MRSTGRGYIAAAAAKDLDEGTFCIAELARRCYPFRAW